MIENRNKFKDKQEIAACETMLPKHEFLARWTLNVQPPIWELGEISDSIQRRIIPISGGTFEGPNFNGIVLNNGADWQIVFKDGLVVIDARSLLQTNDGEYIYLQTSGYRHGPSDVMRKLSKGEYVDPNFYYFRTTMKFETSSRKYDYLNKYIGVACAMRHPDGVVFDGYLLK
jgi:hypothetical protein